MWVKFELTGALEEQFKELCEEECRTLSQQGLYIIKQYLKNNSIEQNIQENNFVEQARTGENESEQVGTGENKSEQTGTEQEDFRQMQDDLVLDVLNF